MIMLNCMYCTVHPCFLCKICVYVYSALGALFDFLIIFILYEWNNTVTDSHLLATKIAPPPLNMMTFITRV